MRLLLDMPKDLERDDRDLEPFDLDDELDDDEDDELCDPTLVRTGLVVIQMRKANITSALRASFSEIWTHKYV